MPLPDRPVAGADIETEWGQAVHDYTFAPKGCQLHGTTRTVTTTSGQLDLSVADDDPGGFLNAVNDRAVVPSGGEGLYFLDVVMNSVNGDVGDAVRLYVYINGTVWKQQLEDSFGGVNVRIAATGLVALTAGDLITVFGQKKGSGTNPTVYVISFQLMRVGAEYGA
jgi:hypothetical protein